jgi:hypothetical protein
MRLIFGDTASLDVTGRDYFVTRVSAADRDRADTTTSPRVDVPLTWRIHEKHAIAIAICGIAAMRIFRSR